MSFFFLISFSYAETDSSHSKVLICLDGVPFRIISDLKEEGFFSDFNKPVPLISTFPAITEIMLTELFHIKEPPGYGLRYYDKSTNRLRGGLGSSEAISVWFSLYDYVTPMLDRGLVYIWPGCGYSDIENAQKKLERFDSGVILMHLDSSDAMFHSRNPRVGINWIKAFERMMANWIKKREEEKRPVDLLLFSDHGNDLTPCKRIEIEKALKNAGYKVGSRIQGESGVAILPTGLISVTYMYTRAKEGVAKISTEVDGVDFAVFNEDGKTKVVSNHGNAVIEKDTRGWFRYEAIDGDPLKLKEIFAEISSKGLTDTDGFVSEKVWFEYTADHTYPDPLKRAWDALHGHVENVADIMLSLKKGWHCGSKALDLIVDFQGTHGSMEKESVIGFAMANFILPDRMRAEEMFYDTGWFEAIKSYAEIKGIALQNSYELGNANGE